MISHSSIRGAIQAVLKADSSVNAVINRAGWYILTTPKALKTPAVVLGTIEQPLVGVAGDPRRQTRFGTQLTVTVTVLCEKHDTEEADEQLGDVYMKVYDALAASKDMGLTGLHANLAGVTTGLFPALGDHVVGADIILSCTVDS